MCKKILFLLALLMPLQALAWTNAEQDLIKNADANTPLPLLTTEAYSHLLKRKSAIIDANNPDMMPLLINQLHATMSAHQGDGIAAIQVGLPYRILLLTRHDKKDSPVEAILNPHVLQTANNYQSTWDGCLSITQGAGRVKRPEWIDIRYQDAQGQKHQERFSGRMAEVLQHELDHLNGLLFTDLIPGQALIPYELFYELELDAETGCTDQEACQQAADKLWQSWQEGHQLFNKSLSN